MSQHPWVAVDGSLGLARCLRAAGVNCVVAASSKLLPAPGNRVKTDPRDAQVLAEMLAVGSVTEVRIPDPDEEALRDLSRLRSGTAKDLAHARQHVNAILLRHGIRYPKETRWTQEHSRWLHRQHFAEPALQFTYEADVEQAELLAGQLKRIDKQVAATAATCRYAPVIEALMCLRGIQITTAFGLAVEIGGWTRFTGSSIGSYLGLVPSENSSGPSRHQGPIAKAGNTYARKLLIEAAWQHRRPYARPGERLLRQLDHVAQATRIRALEGNHRLHHKWEAAPRNHTARSRSSMPLDNPTYISAGQRGQRQRQHECQGGRGCRGKGPEPDNPDHQLPVGHGEMLVLARSQDSGRDGVGGGQRPMQPDGAHKKHYGAEDLRH